MEIVRRAGIATALAVAGAGIAIGGVGLASADGPGSETAPARVAGTGVGEGQGHGGPGRPGAPGGDFAAGLAEELGLEESDVAAALRAVHEVLRQEPPAEGQRPEPPTDADREAARAALAQALAEELGVSEEAVTGALTALDEERRAAGRTALAERLDTAVADGTLTEADKASVLKAHDAGVLRGGPHHLGPVPPWAPSQGG